MLDMFSKGLSVVEALWTQNVVKSTGVTVGDVRGAWGCSVSMA
jgi:hypothetical protein